MSIIRAGIITYKSEVEAKITKAGSTWTKQTIVISREGDKSPYDKVAMSVTGDKVKNLENFKVGDRVLVTYSISAKEYNDKWYNDVILRKLELLQSAPAPVEADAPENLEIQEGDLPF